MTEKYWKVGETWYKPTKWEGISIQIRLDYRKGGYGFADYKYHPPGWFVNCNPCTRKHLGDNVMRTQTIATAGFNYLLFEMPRRTKAGCDIARSKLVSMFDWIVKEFEEGKYKITEENMKLFQKELNENTEKHN